MALHASRFMDLWGMCLPPLKYEIESNTAQDNAQVSC